MRLSPIVLILTASGTAFAAIASQQQPPQQPPPKSSATQEPASASAKQSDNVLATWLLVSNNNEVALAEIAQQRAENPEVKQFAQKMVTDHRQMGQKLQPFASDALSAARAGAAPTGGADGKPQEASASKTGAADQLDHVALLKELGDQCLSSARKELEEKQGAEFDRCFMGMAVGGHMKVNDMMVVFQRHATGDLKNVIMEGQKTVEMHLQHAKELSKKLQGEVVKTPEKK